MARVNRFTQITRQSNLFGDSRQVEWPEIRNTTDYLYGLIVDEGTNNDYVGLDFEGDRLGELGRVPTIVGLARTTGCGAIPWNKRLVEELVYDCEITRSRLVGHSVIGADKPALESALSIVTPLSMWEDSMIAYYLCNAEFCQAPGKGEEEEDPGAMGLMGLWTMAGLYTELAQWKVCRSSKCFGPCPSHDVFSYCAVDAYAGLISFLALKKEMKQKNVPEKLYRELLELSELCDKMQKQGVKIDKAYVTQLEKEFKEHKDNLFPPASAELFGVTQIFNPRSSQQITQYLVKNGLSIKSTDKLEISKLLQSEAQKIGCKRAKVDDTVTELEQQDELPEVLDNILKLYQYKSEGKGLKSWFDDRYIDKWGFIHPRFIVTGTSTGRLASSKPNFQNIPKRGFGRLVRRVIIPREKGMLLLKADFSQLEMRMCLYLAGVDPRSIGNDPFIRLVNDSHGAFEVAAKLNRQKERDVAKRLAHAFDYLEGFKLLMPGDLIKSSTTRDIAAGALRVYPWEWRGGVVAFTGSNLADGLFGDHTLESRKKALALQEDVYSKFFPQIREWQWSVLQSIENRDYVQSPTGRFLRLDSTPEEDAKTAVAFLGQGVSSDHVQGIMLKQHRQLGLIPLMQIHDEEVLEIEPEITKYKDFLKIMDGETDRLPGFSCPYKAAIGPNWYDTKEI